MNNKALKIEESMMVSFSLSLKNVIYLIWNLQDFDTV